MSQSVALHLAGRALDETLPPLLRSSVRSAGGAEDVFLPPSYFQATGTFDVGPVARSTVDGRAEQTHDAPPGEIVVFELADGGTLITSAERLRDNLDQTHPDFVGPGGEVLLDRFRADGTATRGLLGDVVGGALRKVYTLVAGAMPDAIIEAARERLGAGQGDAGVRDGELGVTWAGTKALMWAIESRLDQAPGLYRWEAPDRLANVPAGFGDAAPVSPVSGQPAPMLVFIHGTGSNTFGSFGDLRRGDGDLWPALEARFTGGIFAFEHRTLSESPIDNALDLVEALPRGAHISLVTHSRGGLVGDLLCLDDFGNLIDDFRFRFEGTGDADRDEAARVIRELENAHAEHRRQLTLLASRLSERQLVVERYVRAASPANGTKLASGNFDVFLSSVLTLIGLVPVFFGNPYYSAFKRVVIEVAKNRTNAHLVPGIEAMLPDSPMAWLLRQSNVRDGVAMAVIAGDSEGGSSIQRLGVLLTDFLLFDRDANDRVVDTEAMLAGVAGKAKAAVLFDRGADVSHFRYFANVDTRSALQKWLVAPDPRKVAGFVELPAAGEFDAALAAAVSRDAAGAAARADLPVVVVLPGIMGSHLRVGASDRVWFDLSDIVSGNLRKIAWGVPGVEADELFAMAYGKLCEALASSHRVERFPYDWRQPLDVLADRFGSFLEQLLQQTRQPIRLLAHSMGGLVVRATIHRRRTVMDDLMARPGARFVMLGTPNQGAHSMVENLLGKGDSLRTLARVDLRSDMQALLDLVAGFRGALQLLPKPGFTDTFQGRDDGGGVYDFQKAATWERFKGLVTDLWFGDGRCGSPSDAVLDAGSWLWNEDTAKRPALPSAYEKNSVYVFGVAANTPCGVREEGDRFGRIRLKMVGTTRGDGTVTWESGRIDGVGGHYYMPVAHGDLASTREFFAALGELLASGSTSRLATTPPVVRAIEQPSPVVYDAGPPAVEDALALERALLGGSLSNAVPTRPKRRLHVRIKAGDLRFLAIPVMAGHYEQDPIAGPEALIDRELLDRDLSERYSLGMYAGPCGTAIVVLRAPNAFERARGSLSGAVITGLGKYDGALSPQTLTEAIRAGVLRYLLQTIDVIGKADRELPLASLLVGYNSSQNLTVSASVEAIVTGTMEANARFHEITRLNIRVGRLEIVELYRDTAITAVYALRDLEPRLAGRAVANDTALVIRRDLEEGEGPRQRLFDSRSSDYWPRLIVTEAGRDDADDSEADGGPSTGSTRVRTRLAKALHFLYVGQRARAETVALQRQPGLIEKLVRQQIGSRRWQPDFGRMLFQLMVPPDFKDAARQLDRVVLVVDRATANLPWELMLADETSQARPLALSVPMVRQLSSTTFRRRVRQVTTRNALVIGNPSVEGFAANFVFSNGAEKRDPDDLPGAEEEANAIVALLRAMDHTVKWPVIGNERTASEVLAALYREPYRILHVSGHGVFDLLSVDGRARSGVVLSDGLLITAAEIKAMETVPEVVFLNCCHLGQVDIGREGNLLASSISRELIDIGVRCVIVAGWAVDDAGARIFGQVFYQELLLHRRPFGDAVFAARLAVYEANGDDITWGAFQAYGEAGWRAEPRSDESYAGSEDSYASLDELLDDLATVRAGLSRRSDRQTEREINARVAAIESRLAKRCPANWRELPLLQSSLGATWRDLDQLEKARAAYLKAVQAEDRAGRVPIRDIEQLASIEARLGEKLGDGRVKTAADETRTGDGATAAAVDETPLGLIELALKRLDGLDDLLTASVGGTDGALPPNGARSALRGTAYECRAAVHARRVVSAGDAKTRKREAKAMRDALVDAVRAYRQAEGNPADAGFMPSLALNRLALDALTPWDDATDSSRDAAVALAGQCLRTAEEAFATSPGVFYAVLQSEALLVGMLLDGRLGSEGDAGQLAFDEVARAYGETLSNVTLKPAEIDEVVLQLELLARFCDALSMVGGGDDQRRMADRLLQLVQCIRPDRAMPTSRPHAAVEEAAGPDA